MKRVAAILLTIFLAAFVLGCAEQAKEKVVSQTPAGTTTPQTETTTQTTPEEEELTTVLNDLSEVESLLNDLKELENFNFEI